MKHFNPSCQSPPKIVLSSSENSINFPPKKRNTNFTGKIILRYKNIMTNF